MFLPVALNPAFLGATFWGNMPTPPNSCPQMPLTDVKIRKAKPEAKPRRLYDERGLYLEIAPAGGKW